MPKPTRKRSKLDLTTVLAALPPEATTTQPGIPVAAALQEASDIAKAAKKHAAKLKKLPFDHALLEGMAIIIEGLRDAESEWRQLKTRRADKAVRKARAEGEELKRDMLAAGRYFLREDGSVQSLLDDIAEGDSLADLIDDLHALARFTREQGAKLGGASLPGGPAQIAARAEALARLLSDSASEEAADDTARLALARRNQLAFLLATAVREVREAARYVLRKQPEALGPFRVTYRARPSRRRTGAARPVPVMAED